MATMTKYIDIILALLATGLFATGVFLPERIPINGIEYFKSFFTLSGFPLFLLWSAYTRSTSNSIKSVITYEALAIAVCTPVVLVFYGGVA
jgi:hypothetical protein